MTIRLLPIHRHAVALFAAFALIAAAGSVARLASAQDTWRTDFSRHIVPLSEIVSGGPAKDGIPAIDRPRFVTVQQADVWLDHREPVLVVQHAGTTRIYPVRILLWHEIVNDRIGDLPIAVTFCPLCNTAIAFDRRHAGTIFDFGTTGRLRHSDLVMYDRQTETWWQQATGEGLVGKFAGDTLRVILTAMVSWGTVETAYPGAQVLSQETGYKRPYGTTPYVGYDAARNSPLPAFFRARRDERLPAMERVVAVKLGAESVAYPFSRLRVARVVNDVVAKRNIVVMWAPGAASALDARQLSAGRDVGATGVFDRALKGRTLTFEPAAAGRFRDQETRSTWDVLGRGITGPLRGEQLMRIAAGDYFWFAWAVFRPETRVRN